MAKDLRLQRNILGGQVYVPKTEAQRKADIAKMEAESRQRTEQLKKGDTDAKQM